MSNIKNKIALVAIAIFAAHPKLDEIYITSDGQGFTDPEKAKDNARYHKDNSVKHFERGFEESYVDPDEETSKDEKKDTEPTERQKNFAKYEELFGKKPASNISNEKLIAAIADKEAEIEAAKGQNPEGAQV